MFALELQKMIKENNWTQNEFAKRAGVTQSTVSNIIHGRIACGEKVANKFIKVFNLNLVQSNKFIQLALSTTKPSYLHKINGDKKIIEFLVESVKEKIKVEDIIACHSTDIGKIIIMKNGSVWRINITLDKQ